MVLSAVGKLVVCRVGPEVVSIRTHPGSASDSCSFSLGVRLPSPDLYFTYLSPEFIGSVSWSRIVGLGRRNGSSPYSELFLLPILKYKPKVGNYSSQVLLNGFAWFLSLRPSCFSSYLSQ